MRIEIGKALRESLKFGFSVKRWFPIFLVHIIVFLIFVGLTISNLETFIEVFLAASTDTAYSFAGLTEYISYMYILEIIWVLVLIYTHVAILHQSNKEKEFRKSWTVAKNKYFIALAATIVITLISYIVIFVLSSISPSLGIIASIILGMIFFFVLPAVVIKNFGFVNAIKESYNIFKTNVFKVFVMLVVMSILSMIIGFIFLLPFIFIFSSIFAEYLLLGTITSTTLVSLLGSIETNLVSLLASGIIFIVGLSIAQTFSLKFQAVLYKQFKKRIIGF